MTDAAAYSGNPPSIQAWMRSCSSCVVQRGVARVLRRVARAARALGHLAALDAHERARADREPRAVEVVREVERVGIVVPMLCPPKPQAVWQGPHLLK